ncbi:MAG: 2-dehydropantoate 2-reductase [Betaproteobacteria bacterium]|nr:MAG: 2-dehydropantoate 2-reductase [Betaproteobacteria bacterium]
MNAPAPFPRHVAVLGAGAVGCYFGGMLARAGARVTLIGRPAHVEAIARDGLVVVRDSGETRIRVAATTDDDAVRDADLVLFCVKSTDTEAAARAIAAPLDPAARVVSLQNGVDNGARLAAVLPQPVYAAVVYVGTIMEGPGRVRHVGRGDLVLGVPRAARGRGDASGDLAAIAATFERAGVPCPLSPDVEAALWTKLVINCAFNAVSALGRARYARMAASAGVRTVMEDAVREAIAVARADDVALDEAALMRAVWDVAAAMGQQFSSTAQDVQRGKATEIDALNGYVVRRGAERGVPVPVNRTLHALVKLLEAAPRA